MLSPHPDLQRPPGRLSPLSLPVVAPVAGAPVPAVDGVVLVLGAHPDDETVGAGRLVAHLAARGRVAAHVATAGAGWSKMPRSMRPSTSNSASAEG